MPRPQLHYLPAMSIARLTDRVRHDLACLSFPDRDWTIPRYRNGVRVTDVLIIGGGQSGLAIAFGLKRECINNIRIVDRNPRGLEGPWRRFARMAGLRTPKEVTGIDLGIPSLTARAWYEARFGRRAWREIERFAPDVWRDYLDWFRDVLAIPVENDTEVISIEPADDLLVARLRRKGRNESVPARKIVLATGIEGNGRWRAPSALVAKLPAKRYAHSADNIDFARLAGKRVGVLGVGPSALDNAAEALEAGAARVDLCFRRADIPRVNPLIWTNFTGMLAHFGELTDLQRWRYMRHIIEALPSPPPQDAFWRCRQYKNFAWHPNSVWRSVQEDAGAATVHTQAGNFRFDFIIFATGFETNLSARPELASIVDQIALWRDRFTPPAGEGSDLLAGHPYLGAAFEFIEREPGAAPFLGRLHNFTLGAMVSLGVTGAAISGIRYGVPRLVDGLTRDLFREDASEYYRDLLKYAVPELVTLEAPFDWIDQLAAAALSGRLNRLKTSFAPQQAIAPRHLRDEVDAVRIRRKGTKARAGTPGPRRAAKSGPPPRCPSPKSMQRKRARHVR